MNLTSGYIFSFWFLIILVSYLFIFDCAGSSWLCLVFSLVAARWVALYLRCAGFWPWFVSWSPGSGAQASAVGVNGLISSAVCPIFWDQRWILCLLCWQADSLPLSHQGNHSFSLLKLCYPILFFPQTSKLLVLLV